MNEIEVKTVFDGFDISNECKCGSREFSIKEVCKSIIDFYNGCFEELFPYFIIECIMCGKKIRIET